MRLIERLFAVGLLLYPPGVRREFAAEMQAVFSLRARDAAARGPAALLMLALREMRDLPLAAASAHLHFPGGEMNHYFPDTSDQVSWPAALLSLLPLFLIGAGRTIVFYTSGFGGAHEQWYFLPYLGLACLAALLALGIGALFKFPRWSYPYALGLVIALSDLYSTATYHFKLPTIGQNICFGFLALSALILCLPALRVFYRNMRRDWTLISYSLFALVLYLLAQVDTDEDPRLTLGVLLPSLIALGTALAHLRIRQAPVRVLVLVAGTFVGLAAWLSGLITGMISIPVGILITLLLLTAYFTILSAFLLSPLLVILLRQRLRSRQT